jgi:hypothetical protein
MRELNEAGGANLTYAELSDDDRTQVDARFEELTHADCPLLTVVDDPARVPLELELGQIDSAL